MVSPFVGRGIFFDLLSQRSPWIGVLVVCGVLTLPGRASSDTSKDGARRVSFHGYDDCIRLENATTTVTLCPAAGGRVLEYSLNGINSLHLPTGDEGWEWDGKRGYHPLKAGRFDIGPEKMIRRGQVLWAGRWDAEITGPRQATLTSQTDEESGVVLVREFQLDEQGTRLQCRQTIKNVSEKPVSVCHWSRTFAVGNGIAIVPRTTEIEKRRFPLGWVMYGKQNQIFFRPQDDAVQVTEEAIYIHSAPEFPKLGFDSLDGRLAYLAPNGLLFAKEFPTFPNRAYNEVAGLTISVWYPNQPMVELEPIGPAEYLKPGQDASFTETWSLHEHTFPESVKDLRWEEIRSQLGWD